MCSNTKTLWCVSLRDCSSTTSLRLYSKEHTKTPSDITKLNSRSRQSLTLITESVLELEMGLDTWTAFKTRLHIHNCQLTLAPATAWRQCVSVVRRPLAELVLSPHDARARAREPITSWWWWWSLSRLALSSWLPITRTCPERTVFLSQKLPARKSYLSPPHDSGHDRLISYKCKDFFRLIFANQLFSLFCNASTGKS